MRVTRRQKDEHRAGLLDAASRLMRTNGPERVGVADVAAAAGLTHGAFYGHFASKDALFAEAVAAALDTSVERVERRGSPDRLRKLVDAYLRSAHIEDSGAGCPLPSLGVDVSRASPEVRQAFAQGLQRYFESLAGTSHGGEITDQVVATVAGLVGTLVLARAVQGVDDDLARRIVEAARNTLPARRSTSRKSKAPGR
jgi:TetR/AcrR family transcriptional repressor of nem operon